MDTVYYYWLSTIEGIGIIKAKQIVDFFGSAWNAWEGSREDYRKIKGISELLIEKIIERRDYGKLACEMEYYSSKGINIITIDNADYPERLKNIFYPPFILYTKGKLSECAKYIAIVGARRCTSYGRLTARKIARELAEYNIGIISGMASGIDTEAHMGVLEGNGFTCAVLGCGCDVLYPPENGRLKSMIEDKGMIISEYPPGTIPNPFYFPARNRIISGLSDGVLVVEAGEKSGSLITANYALEQGREVFAVPGSIVSNTSCGTNSLIKDGAVLVRNVEDILDELNIKPMKRSSTDMPESGLDIREKAIIDAVSDCPIYIDDLLRRVSLKISEINSLLTSMEIKGMLKVLPGKFVVKI